LHRASGHLADTCLPGCSRGRAGQVTAVMAASDESLTGVTFFTTAAPSAEGSARPAPPTPHPAHPTPPPRPPVAPAPQPLRRAWLGDPRAGRAGRCARLGWVAWRRPGMEMLVLRPELAQVSAYRVP